MWHIEQPACIIYCGWCTFAHTLTHTYAQTHTNEQNSVDAITSYNWQLSVCLCLITMTIVFSSFALALSLVVHIHAAVGFLFHCDNTTQINNSKTLRLSRIYSILNFFCSFSTFETFWKKYTITTTIDILYHIYILGTW